MEPWTIIGLAVVVFAFAGPPLFGSWMKHRDRKGVKK
jgi:hypothetical protein